MAQTSLNLLALLVAIAAKQGLGILWYSPVLFGRPFAEASGQTPQVMRQTLKRGLAGDCVGALLIAVGLSYATGLLEATNWFYGVLAGIGCWLVFAVPATAGPMLFEGRSFKLFSLHNGYLAVSFGVMGGVLGAWR